MGNQVVDLRFGENDLVGFPSGTNHESTYWYDRMVGELDDYVADPQYDFDFGWRQSLMPWHPTESINDMMSGEKKSTKTSND